MTFTIEQLAEMTGYSVATLRCMVSDGILPKAVRAAQGLKGLYPKEALDRLLEYKELKAKGTSRSEIIKLMTREAQ